VFWLILTGLTYGSGSPSVSPKARLTMATSQHPMPFTTIGQSILLETVLPAGIDVYTPIYLWFPSWWFGVNVRLSCPNSQRASGQSPRSPFGLPRMFPPTPPTVWVKHEPPKSGGWCFTTTSMLSLYVVVAPIVVDSILQIYFIIEYGAYLY
jgi:hypothetical protein